MHTSCLPHAILDVRYSPKLISSLSLLSLSLSLHPARAPRNTLLQIAHRSIEHWSIFLDIFVLMLSPEPEQALGSPEPEDESFSETNRGSPAPEQEADSLAMGWPEGMPTLLNKDYLAFFIRGASYLFFLIVAHRL